MLNEFHLLAKALVRSGYGLSELSPSILVCNCGGLVIIHLDDGNLRVEYFTKERKVWYYAPHNKLSFPRGKMTGPFYQTTEDDTDYFKRFKNKETRDFEKIAALRELVAKSSVTADKAFLKKFWKSWREYPNEIADQFLTQLDPEEPLTIVLTKLSSGPAFSIEEAQRILVLLSAELLRGCEEGQIPFEYVQTLLVGGTKSKEIVFFHDCRPSPLTTEMKKRLNELIQAPKVGADKQGICSLTGQHEALVIDTFPQVKLPVFGQKTALLAMNKDIPCQERHEVIAAAICPVGENTTKEMATALDQITKKENEGKTWKGIPSNVKKKRDLLIVYCEDNPMDQVHYADDIVGEDDDDDTQENEQAEKQQVKERFRSTTQTAIDAHDGKVPDSESYLLRCFILREIDPGRRQVVYSDSFTVKELFAAAADWKKAGENIPEITYSYSLKKKVAATIHKACSPSLSRTVKLFQTVWGSDVTRSTDVAGISFHEVLGLFLSRKNIKHTPREMLSLLVRRAEQLLSAVGEADHIRNHEKRKIEVNAKRTTLDVVAMFGILLSKIDEYENTDKKSKQSFYKKEQYMEDVYYNLGRFLMLIDHLHVEYCLKQRSGDVPPKLLGNAMIPVANANAVKALARLEERLCPYTGWAKKYIYSVSKDDQENAGNDKEDKRKLVGWYLMQINRVVSLLKKAELPNRRLNDVEKAQLLLGYLSGLEKSQKSSHATTETENAETQEQVL